ncbi:hypothetical protein GOP47_0007394 [Adiantum capillus-veneris]|uniref:Uncharacterized protein n=1 Tax=Adiantum capillus-veneris TaxID=13818 RepID=A0A9D4V181_ADICA|nr:hypothetical protein GOP47_0007394 [Adiantum capillus-veneris]
MLSDSPRHLRPGSCSCGYWSMGCNFLESAVNNFSALKVTDGDFFYRSVLPSAKLLVGLSCGLSWSCVLVPSKPCKNVGLLRLALPLFNSRAQPRRSFGFGVSQLQLATFPEPATWVVLARTPQHLLPPPTKSYRSYELASAGPLFYLTSARCGVECRPPLVFDMAQNSWYWLPSDKVTKDFLCTEGPLLGENRRRCGNLPDWYMTKQQQAHGSAPGCCWGPSAGRDLQELMELQMCQDLAHLFCHGVSPCPRTCRGLTKGDCGGWASAFQV